MLFILVLTICVHNFMNVNAEENNLNLLGKVIYIDPGHGGLDPGTIYKDIYEKDINLEICLKLEEVLEKEELFNVS